MNRCTDVLLSDLSNEGFVRANTLQFARVTDNSFENATKSKSSPISRARYRSQQIIVGHDRRDRFVEAQTAVIPVLCPAEALNSGSRQRRSVITRKEPGGGGDGEKSCVKRESGICQRLLRINDDEPTGGAEESPWAPRITFNLPPEGFRIPYLITSYTYSVHRDTTNV